MTSHDALWSEMFENPHDDEPRLRLAELYDDADPARGEFIRLQCQLEKLPLRNPLRLVLEAREHELLADHERQWLGELDSLVDWAVFHRGFPEEIATSVDLFLKHGDSIVALAPIRMVHLSGGRDRMAELAACPALGRIGFLDLSNNHLRDFGAKRLAQSPLVRGLEGLNLSSTGLGDAGLRHLAESPYLIGLKELYLCDNRISRSGLRALNDSPLLERLEILSLRANACDDARDLLRADPVLSLHT